MNSNNFGKILCKFLKAIIIDLDFDIDIITASS